MESEQSSLQSKTHLFPAYTSSIQSKDEMAAKKPEQPCSSSTPLFPAYTTNVQNQEENKDWLCNSSFTESALNQVSSQLLKSQEEECTKDSVPNDVRPIEISTGSKKKKSHKRKADKKYPDPSSFLVPDSESILHQLKKKTFIEETGLSYERAFQKDNTRDPENLMFDGFERTKIASYVSLKIPIGLSSKESVIWTQNLPKHKNEIPNRYFSKKSLKLLKSAGEEVIVKSHSSSEITELNYIPVSQISVSTVNPFIQESFPNFINVSSSWKSEGVEKERGTQDKTVNESVDIEMRGKVIYFNKTLSEDPSNIDLWIDFVDFQDELFLSESNSKSLSQAKSNVTEKKIAILEKALKHNPKDVRLNTMKLNLCKDLYSSDKVISMWDELIFYNPNNVQVWQKYLLYHITNIDQFNIPNVIKLYGRCLKTLSNVSEGITESHEPSPDIIPNMLGIFNQLCYVLKSCDFSEKAIAAYQALVEFNLFCEPAVENLELSERIVFLEPFWDSGAPRVGENNAIGWASTVELKKISSDHISTDSDLNHMEDDILNKKLTTSETWLEFEKLRTVHHWLPWKPNPEYDQTDDDIDDIDRTVSFEDVSKFLFIIPSEEHKFLLLLHFVTFLGFDVHALCCHNMGNKVPCNPLDLENYEITARELNESHLILNSINPLCFDADICTEERYNFINNIFSQVTDKFSLRYKILCTHMWIKFKRHYLLDVKKERKENTTHLKKFVKSVLKKSENRNCLLLWLEYISIEWSIDRKSALKTFHSLLLSSTSAVSEGSMHFQVLAYFAQAFTELCMNNFEISSEHLISSDEILWILSHITSKEKYIPYSGQKVKPTVILKAVSSLKNALEKELNSLTPVQNTLCYCIDPCSFTVINAAKCFAYFQYFNQGFDAAMQVYENTILAINSKINDHSAKYISEQINVTQAKLLNYHTWNSSSSIRPLKTFLCDSIAKYPHNSQLLYLLVQLRSASSVINPTRRFLGKILKNHHKSHPTTWIFALVTEYAICSSLLSQNDVYKNASISEEVFSHLGINWRIRSLYENMLQSDNCVHLPILWRSYLKFEIMTNNMERAKSIFHRALQTCVWSKELMMDAVKYFPDELKEILALMSEKQIRIHTPLEEVTLLMEHAVTDP